MKLRLKLVLTLGLALAATGARGQETTAGETVLSDFETMDWETLHSDNARIEASAVDGQKGKAVQIAYDLKAPGEWVILGKNMAVGDSAGKSFQFFMKATGSQTSNLEFKLIDADGSVYGSKVPLAASGKFVSVTLDMKTFTYWWGGNSTLDKVVRVEFAVSGGSGKGTVALDELKQVPAEATGK